MGEKNEKIILGLKNEERKSQNSKEVDLIESRKRYNHGELLSKGQTDDIIALIQEGVIDSEKLSPEQKKYLDDSIWAQVKGPSSETKAKESGINGVALGAAGLVALVGTPILDNVAIYGEAVPGAVAEEKEYFIFEDKELLDKLYNGLVMNGVKEDTVVEGFYSYTDNTTNELAAGLFREADGLEIIFLTDKGVRDPESQFVLKKITYCDFDEERQFGFSQRYNDAGNPIYFINLADVDGNTIFKCQITEEEARRGFAVLDTSSLKDDISAKRGNFMNFCTELQENYPEIAQALNEMDTSVPDETKGSEVIEEKKPFIFDEEYINRILDAILKEGKDGIDGYVSNSEAYPGMLNIILRSIDNLYIEIEADKGMGNSKKKITQVKFYSIEDETNEYYGFAQRYTYDKKGKRKTNNIVFIGPLGSTEVMGYDGLSDEDFWNGVTMLEETELRDRKEVFDAFYEEMDQKYDPKSKSHAGFTARKDSYAKPERATGNVKGMALGYHPGFSRRVA